MITVEYPPGGSDPVHTHNAQALVYVLEGSIVMQVKGRAPITLKPGETFYEGRDDVHIVGRNASHTAPAKFLVVLVKEKGAPILVPVMTHAFRPNRRWTHRHESHRKGTAMTVSELAAGSRESGYGHRL